MPQGNKFGVRGLVYGNIIYKKRDERGFNAMENTCRDKKIDCM